MKLSFTDLSFTDLLFVAVLHAKLMGGAIAWPAVGVAGVLWLICRAVKEHDARYRKARGL